MTLSFGLRAGRMESPSVEIEDAVSRGGFGEEQTFSFGHVKFKMSAIFSSGGIELTLVIYESGLRE